jgi:prepilin-type processing-associated H-X9-DG protein
MNQIKGASKRFVFLDDGYPSPDSYAVFYYRGDQWIDPPMARHGSGTDVSYADGHVGRLMWKCPETVKTANKEPVVFFWAIPTNNCAASDDLYKMQVGVWGKIGYTPAGLPPGCTLSTEEN